MHRRYVQVALLVLPHLLDPSPKLTAGAWPTTMEMPRPAIIDAFLVIMRVLALGKLRRLRLQVQTAHIYLLTGDILTVNGDPLAVP